MMQQFMNVDENDVNGMQDAERATEEMFQFQQMISGMMTVCWGEWWSWSCWSVGVSGGAVGIDT